ncbi:MAG: alcohol dehydrogenase catalytic domain-containing protein, partial [Gaiellales bacterium]
MRVVHLTAFGDPDVLKPAEVPDSEPRPGQVVVDLVRAALNHREVWIREGRPGPLPAVLGSDGAGVVSEVGS